MSKSLQIVLFAVAAVFLSSCGRSPEPLELDVLCYNIRYLTERDVETHWEHRKDFLSETIAAEAADVVCIQEAMRQQLDDIAERVPGYKEVGVGRADGVTEGEYAAILFRQERLRLLDSGTFWLSETPDQPGSRDWGNNVTRICTWARLQDQVSERSFWVYNTHYDHQSELCRRLGTVLIHDKILARSHPDEPFFLTGDFNTGEDSWTVKFLKGTQGPLPAEEPAPDAETPAEPPKTYTSQLKLVDTFRVIHPDQTDVGTFNGWKGRTTGAKIDYIFVEPTTKVLDAAIFQPVKDGLHASDHYPLRAKLQM